MTFKILNYISSQEEVFNSKEEAEARIQELKPLYLEHENHRFSIAKEVVDGNNTTWMAADLENDDPQGSYNVFNTLTGSHELVEGLSNAIIRNNQIKEEFWGVCAMSKPIEVVENTSNIEISSVINV